MGETGYSRSDLRSLLELQRYDSEVSRLRVAVERAWKDPEVESLRRQADEASCVAQAAKERLVKLRHGITWEEKESDNIRTEIAGAERKMYGGLVSNPKELDQMQKRVEQLRGDLSRHAESGLAAMVDVEEAEPALARAEAAETQAHTRLAGALAKQKAIVAGLEREIAAFTPKRAEMATRVPAVLLAKYERIRDNRSGVAAAAIRPDGLCGACLVEVPRALAKAILDGRLETCESCGRLLIHLFAAAAVSEAASQGDERSQPGEPS
jgi:predicted  nucleic acid-binding Zn-ribbon protein